MEDCGSQAVHQLGRREGILIGRDLQLGIRQPGKRDVGKQLREDAVLQGEHRLANREVGPIRFPHAPVGPFRVD